MAEMTQTLASMRQSIERKIHARDSVGPLKSAIDRAINDAYSRIIWHNEWVWTQAEGVMLTYAKVPDGGITITPDPADYSTIDVTGVTLTNIGSGWILKSGDTWRQISSVDIPGEEVSLAVAWPNGDAITTWEMFAASYNPSSLAIGKMQKVVCEGEEVVYKDPITFSEDYLMTPELGTPEYYTILKYSSLGNPILAFGPIPDTELQITMRYYRRPQALVNDTDTPILPPQFHYVIEEGALSDLYGAFFHDQYQAQRHEAMFTRALQTMMRENQGATRQVAYMGGPKSPYDWTKVDPYGV